MLEKRLNDTLVKFNIEIQGNRSLRDLIGEKRRDRCIFDEIYSELERDMQRLSQQMRSELETENSPAESRRINCRRTKGH